MNEKFPCPYCCKEVIRMNLTAFCNNCGQSFMVFKRNKTLLEDDMISKEEITEFCKTLKECEL